MRKGGGKQKGAAFERKICERLSLWVSRQRNQDCFWRSAMSGGRATVARRKDVELKRQAGDICATAPEGHALTDRFYIELKHYKDLSIDRFILNDTGTLARFWEHTRAQARLYGRSPMLIVRQNLFPVLLIAEQGAMAQICDAAWVCKNRHCSIYLFDSVMLTQFKVKSLARVTVVKLR